MITLQSDRSNNDVTFVKNTSDKEKNQVIRMNEGKRFSRKNGNCTCLVQGFKFLFCFVVCKVLQILLNPVLLMMKILLKTFGCV